MYTFIIILAIPKTVSIVVKISCSDRVRFMYHNGSCTRSSVAHTSTPPQRDRVVSHLLDMFSMLTG